MSYSVAIRTLALNPDALCRVIESVFGQTCPPREVVVYLAEGFAAPARRVGSERYVIVKKGMMNQRVLRYDELGAPYILMLDDDVLLGKGLAGRLLKAFDEGYDLLGVDVMKTHQLPVAERVKAAVTGLVFPSRSAKKAFRLRRDGSFNYITRPEEGKIYPTDTIAGPVMFWRRSVWDALRMTDELWLQNFEFAYGDDALESFKATANGYKVGCLFTKDVINLDAATSSSRYEADSGRFYVRTLASLLAWHRMLYRPAGKRSLRSLGAFALKQAWMLPVMTAASVAMRSMRPLRSHLRALRDGHRIVSTPPFATLPPYII